MKCKIIQFISLIILGILCFQASAQKQDSLQQALALAKHDTTRANIYLELANQNKNDLALYSDYATKALEYSLSSKHFKVEAKARLAIGYGHMLVNKLSDAEKEFEKVFEISEQVEDKKIISSAYIYSAYVKNLKGKKREAIQLQHKSLAINKKLKDTIGIVQCYNALGDSYRRIGNYKEALNKTLTGLRMAEKIKNIDAIRSSMSNLVIVYTSKDDYKQAIVYGKKLLAAYDSVETIGQIQRKAACLENLGTIYRNYSEDPADALPYYEQAIALLKKHKMQDIVYSVLPNLARTHHEMGNYIKAEHYLTEALQGLSKQGTKEEMAYIFNELGLIQIKNNKLARALKNFDKAEAYSLLQKDLQEQSVAFKGKASVYEKMGNTQGALKYLQKYNSVKDSLINQESERAMVEMKEKYDSEKKDLEIDVLKKQNEIDKQKSQRQQLLLFASIGLAILIGAIAFLKIRQHRLKQDLKIERFRVKVASDLHDDVGSTLSSISMYSEVLKQKLSAKHPDSTPMLESISDGSQDIMEALSDIVWTINPKNNSIKSLLKRIMLRTKDLCEAREIKFVYNEEEIMDSDMDMDMAQNIYLSLKEAINNALKHSKCKELKLSIRQEKGKYEFELIDDGTGFDISKAIHGNGMNTMRERIEGFGGQFNINSSDKGTHLKFIFTL